MADAITLRDCLDVLCRYVGFVVGSRMQYTNRRLSPYRKLGFSARASAASRDFNCQMTDHLYHILFFVLFPSSIITVFNSLHAGKGYTMLAKKINLKKLFHE